MFYWLLSSRSSDKNNLLVFWGAKSSILAILISACFSYPFQILPTLINILFLFALVSSYCDYKPVLSCSIDFKFSKVRYIIIVFSFVVIPLFIQIQYKNYKTHLQWNKAIDYSRKQLYQEANIIYENIYPELKKNGSFLLNYGGALMFSKNYFSAIKILEECSKINSEDNLYVSLAKCYQKIGKNKLAEEMYIKSINMIPMRFYPKYQLVKLYQALGNKTKAKN